jgi:hypothetical protein
MTQVVGVIGASYSGTTVLASLLQNIPGVTAFGEAHWLVDNRALPGNRCSSCKTAECPVTAALGTDYTDATLVTKICDVLGGDYIVLSEKWGPVYERLMRPQEMLGVYCFKQPGAQIASMRHHNENMDPPHYARFHEYLSGWAERFCKKLIFVDYEVLCADPAGQIDRIAAFFGMQAPPATVTYPPPGAWHYYAGNVGAVKSTGISLDTRWKAELTTNDLKAIADCRECQAAYARLLERV